MNIETNKFKIITPTDGMWLCNRTDKTCSQKVYMAVNTDHSRWEEITEEEKNRLELEWESEVETDEDAEYAKAGKIILGVDE